MSHKYIVLRQSYDYDGITYNSYGVAFAEKYDECVSILESYTDVSCDLHRVEEFVRVCNELEIDPNNFCEVVADFLADV